MRDESWNFLSTFLEIWTNCTVFGVEFNGVIRIFDFRQAITSKIKKKLKYLVRLYKSCHFYNENGIFS